MYCLPYQLKVWWGHGPTCHTYSALHGSSSLVSCCTSTWNGLPAMCSPAQRISILWHDGLCGVYSKQILGSPSSVSRSYEMPGSIWRQSTRFAPRGLASWICTHKSSRRAGSHWPSSSSNVVARPTKATSRPNPIALIASAPGLATSTCAPREAMRGVLA